MNYTSKQFQIQALQWTGRNQAEMAEFLGADMREVMFAPNKGEHYYFNWKKSEWGLIIITPRGDLAPQVGDYIVKGLIGEYYPMEEEVFKSYFTKEETFDEKIERQQQEYLEKEFTDFQNKVFFGSDIVVNLEKDFIEKSWIDYEQFKKEFAEKSRHEQEKLYMAFKSRPEWEIEHKKDS